MTRLILRLALIVSLAGVAPGQILTDDFESAETGLAWTISQGTGGVVEAGAEPRIAGVALPNGGARVFKQASDGDTGGVHLALTGDAARDMTVEAWVFCEGNDGPSQAGGYQAIVARASVAGLSHFVRLAWDPDHSEAGDTGDGWVKIQAYDGITWDYLGIDFAQFGAASQGYFVNGTAWPSGWHRFKIVVEDDSVSAFVDDMDTPVVTGTMSVSLRNGHPGFYTYTSGDYAAYFDDFSTELIPLPPPPDTDFDVLILNGSVIRDGDSEAEAVDVGVLGDRIAALGDLSGATGTRTIDATGMLVVPGFIDVHTHADSPAARAEYLRQGVTTMVAGNCGSSLYVPAMAANYDGLAGRLGTNYVGLIGHNELRSNVGLSGSTPTAVQMQRMKDYIASAMDAGAFGLSTGLIYNSGFNSTTEEIIELATAVAERGGIYATHMRSEGETVLAAVEEAIQIGRESGARVEISHIKCAGPTAWDLSDEFLALVDEAVADGVDVWMDQYPYPASQTTINAIIPDWAENNWADAVANHREELEQGIRDIIAGRGGADRVYMIGGPFPRRYLDEVATSLGKDPEDVIIDDVGLGGTAAIYFTMKEEDVRVFMVHPRVMVGSDGPTGAHPRGQGTFPRVWGHYGRDLGFFDHQECVDKTSTRAARHFRLVDQKRGRIKPGWFADITVLDPDTVIDRATFDSPGTSPPGIPYVLVNGVIAINNGGYTGALAGKVLRSYDSKAAEESYWAIR